MWTFLRFVVAWTYTLVMSAAAYIFMVILGPKRGWLLICRRWARGALWLVGVKVKIEGVENLAGPAVFVSNHRSLIDVVVLPAILPATMRWVAKRELQKIPVWGWAFARGGAVLIDRGNPRTAMLGIREALKTLPAGWSMVLFPEGTRSADSKLKRFKKGAFHIALETRLPMVPIGMDGVDEIIHKGDWLVRGGEVRVTVGKPIPTTHWSHETLDQHITQVREAVQECIDRSMAQRPPKKRWTYHWPKLPTPPWRRAADAAHNSHLRP